MTKLVLKVALGAAMASSQVSAQAPATVQPPAATPTPVTPATIQFTRQQAQEIAARMFEDFDVNHDGTATRAEAEQVRAKTRGKGHMIDRVYGTAKSLTLPQFEAAMLAEFDAEDANHDGFVSPAEYQQARAKQAAAASKTVPNQ